MSDQENIFWDRIIEMPDVEAIQELNLRKDELGLENAMLLNKKVASKNMQEAQRIGAVIQENNALFTKINSHIRMVNDRLQKNSWRMAVQAIFGDEGVYKCREWIMIQEGRK